MLWFFSSCPQVTETDYYFLENLALLLQKVKFGFFMKNVCVEGAGLMKLEHTLRSSFSTSQLYTSEKVSNTGEELELEEEKII